MTDQAELVTQLLTQVSNMQQQMAALQQQGATPGAAWMSAAPLPKPVGMSVPIKLEGPAGSVRYYLHFGAECAATLDAQIATLEAIERAGLPLDSWSRSGWGRGNEGYQRGTYSNRGGKWQR